MKQLSESILDKDFDVQGIEMYDYNWLTWPVVMDSGFGKVALSLNNNKFILANIGELLNKLQEVSGQIQEVENGGICSDQGWYGHHFREFKNIVKSSTRSLEDLEKESDKSLKEENPPLSILNNTDKFFDLLNDVFSDKAVASIVSKWSARSSYMGILTNHSTSSNYLKITSYINSKRESDALEKAVSKACKKHKLKYETHWTEDTADEFSIIIDVTPL